MKRRLFIRESAMTVVGISVFGKLACAESCFVADSPTATDILGPFYRPNAPSKTDINPLGFKGRKLEIVGSIFDDRRFPVDDCLVEIWQAESDGFYDNLSDGFNYRGSQKTGKNGRYRFVTTLPPPEPTDESLAVYRPAHIHLRISSRGHQDLITQIYFQGDSLLETDPSTKAGAAIHRVLVIEKVSGKNDSIRFDVHLKKQNVPDDKLFQTISGIYKMTDGSLMRFYREGDLLFYQINNQIWGGIAYEGDLSFGGDKDHTAARFEPQSNGEARVWFRFSRRRDTRLEGKKILDY